MNGEAFSVRPVRFPAAYGTPGGPESLLPWSHVEERMRRASNYWIVTVGANARPHARPVDGVWVDGALCFGGSPQTRWVRNLMANRGDHPRRHRRIRHRPRTPARRPLHGGLESEYPQYFSGTEPPFRPFWALRPATAFAWTLEGFPRGATRWCFEAR